MRELEIEGTVCRTGFIIIPSAMETTCATEFCCWCIKTKKKSSNICPPPPCIHVSPNTNNIITYM